MNYFNEADSIYAKSDSRNVFESLLSPVDKKSQGRVVCSVCMAFICRTSDIMEVNGSEVHSCVNPAGIRFTLICFSDSECSVRGKPTEEFTWFPGFAWSYALCPECGSHLGWNYTGRESCFFGLIKDMLYFSGYEE